MGKLSQLFKNLIGKWKELSKRKKIAFGVIFAGIIAALIFAGISLGSTKYAVLFSNLSSTDSANIYKQLQSDKVTTKVQGNSILVPKDQVDKVRMQVLSEVQMTNGSQGFELLDKSGFGSTDAQMKITYQRALQGELERTIKGFSEVSDARVHLVIPDDTAFEKDTDPGTASVTLKLKPGQSLTQDQVKSVVALISGAVKNIPAKNVQVMDDNMNLLSKDLYTDTQDGQQSTTSADKQQQLQKQYENDLQKRLQDMLDTVYGKGKAKAIVNAELDFDAIQQDAVTYDPKSVVVSENDKKSVSNSGTVISGGSNSPIDNNMTNSTSTNNGNGISTYEETTKNYDVSKVEQKTIKAPGAVKRLTASVALDGNVDAATKTAITNLAVSSIGYNTTRGDTISVEGIPFDTTLKDKAKQDLADMNKATQQAQRNKLYTIIGIIAAVIIAAAVGIFLWMRKNRKEEEEAFEDEFGSTQSIDTIIGDDDMTRQQPKFKPVDFEEENEQTHLESEIKKYAKDKPDQVADVIKSWLAEDER